MNWASLVIRMVKNLPAMQETQVQSVGQEESLEKEMATHSSILAWRIPWTVQSMGSQSWNDWGTNTLWSKSFCYLSLGTALTLEQVSQLKILREK